MKLFIVKYSNTVCVLPFLERNQTSHKINQTLHPYKTAGKVMAILIFTL
jgi:hypothetical protein